MRAAVHCHGHISLGQRWCVVGAVTGHGDQTAFGLILANQLELVFRRGLGQKVVHTGFGGNGGGCQLVVAGDHHGFDAHAAQLAKAFLDAGLDNVFELHDTHNLLAVTDRQRRAAPARNVIRCAHHFSGHAAAQRFDMLANRIHRALAQHARAAAGQGHIHAAHAGLGCERNFCRVAGQRDGGVELLRQRDDAAAFRRFIGHGRLHRAGGQRLLADTRRGQKQRGLAVAVGDGAGFIQHQHIHVACRFHRAA